MFRFTLFIFSLISSYFCVHIYFACNNFHWNTSYRTNVPQKLANIFYLVICSWLDIVVLKAAEILTSFLFRISSKKSYILIRCTKPNFLLKLIWIKSITVFKNKLLTKVDDWTNGWHHEKCCIKRPSQLRRFCFIS